MGQVAGTQPAAATHTFFSQTSVPRQVPQFWVPLQPSPISPQMLTAGGQTEIVQTGVSAQFDGTTISGNAGCNSYNASYEASGSEISFGPIAATKKICPEDEQSTEDRYLQLLAEIGSFEVSGRSMSMNDTDGTPVLQFMQG